MRSVSHVGAAVACALALMSGCAGTIDPEPEVEATPERTSSAELFGQADGLIADQNADGAERACALARDATTAEALVGEEANVGQARAAFCDAEVARLRWESVRMDSPDMKELQASLQTKLSGIESVRALYNAVYAFDVVEWTLAAGTREASLYEHFARTLRESPTPDGFDDESTTLYRQQIDELSEPLLAEALTRYSIVVKKADETGFSSKYVDIARTKSTPDP